MNWAVRILILIYILIVIFVSLGCKTMDAAPITHFYVIDTDHAVCSVREITDKNSLSSVRVATVPLEQCDGVWGLSADEFSKLRVYLKGK